MSKNAKPKRAGIYVRCSTSDQDTSMQERALGDYAARRGWEIEAVYKDEGISGARPSRPGLSKLFSDCKRGKIDVVLVWKFDRFARSLTQLLQALMLFKALGISFVSSTEEIDTDTPSGEFVFQVMGAVAQFERDLIRERVKSGLVHARRKGKRLGRPPLKIFSSAEKEEIKAMRSGGTSVRHLAIQYGTTEYIIRNLTAAPLTELVN